MYDLNNLKAAELNCFLGKRGMLQSKLMIYPRMLKRMHPDPPRREEGIQVHALAAEIFEI